MRIARSHRRSGSSRRARIEACDDQSGLDQDHVDAEAPHLEAHGVADGLQGVLAGVIDPTAGEGQSAAHRTDVDQLAFPALTHARKNELAHADETEDIGLELSPDILDGD